MTLTEIIRQRTALEAELDGKARDFLKYQKETTAEINALKEKEALLENGFDLEKVELGRMVVTINGNPYGDTGCSKDKTIAEEAIRDILDGCKKLKVEYFGNKRYEGFYQRSDHDYGLGPTYGTIVDRIELNIRKRDLTPEEAEAAIYYIRVYNKIEKMK